MSGLQLGDYIPNFQLPTVTDEKYLFEEKKNKSENAWHLIVFFRGSWCPYCIKTLTDIENHLHSFKNNNLHIVAIAAENLEKLKRMSDQQGYTFPILSDEFFSVLDAFNVFTHKTGAPYEDHGAHGEPAYFLVNEEGKLMYQQKQTGPFGRPSPQDLAATAEMIKDHLKKISIEHQIEDAQ